MRKVTITNSAYQDKINKLEKALLLLNEAKTIIEEQAPTPKMYINEPEFCRSYQAAHTDCEGSILNIGYSIGDLVSRDIQETYVGGDMAKWVEEK